MNIEKELRSFADMDMQLSSIDIDPKKIKAILINEVVPLHPSLDFYSEQVSDYANSTIALFQKAGAQVEDVQDILELGIYLTNAIKLPKLETTISTSTIEQCLPILEKELSLFPNVCVIMLMGDVAKKAFNKITRKHTKKAVIPAISTYKLRNQAFYYNDMRIIPSYIMTGKNVQIEKSKVEMASEDIALMLDIIKAS